MSNKSTFGRSAKNTPLSVAPYFPISSPQTSKITAEPSHAERAKVSLVHCNHILAACRRRRDRTGVLPASALCMTSNAAVDADSATADIKDAGVLASSISSLAIAMCPGLSISLTSLQLFLCHLDFFFCITVIIFITDRVRRKGKAIVSVRLTIRLFQLYLMNRLTFERVFVCVRVMTTARLGLKINVIGQILMSSAYGRANALTRSV